MPPEATTKVVNYIHNDGSSVALTLQFSPNANIQINVNGKPFVFDFGGVHIGGTVDASLHPVLQTWIQDISAKIAEMDTQVHIGNADIYASLQASNEMSALLAGIISIQNNLGGGAVPTEDAPTQGTQRDVKGLAYVKVTITKIPNNAKMQFGLQGPNLLYAGWFEFLRGGEALPREPLSFANGIFKAPQGADGYAYTLYVGFEATVTPVTFKDAGG